MHLQERGCEAASIEEQRGAAGEEGKDPASVTNAKGNAVMRHNRKKDDDGDNG